MVKRIGFILLLVLIVGITGCASQNESVFPYFPSGVHYYHDAERGVGIWTNYQNGICVLPDSEYLK
jgi:hypothetical protein